MTQPRLSPRDQHMAAAHQSAHIAVALVLGGNVEGLSPGLNPESIQWSLDRVATEDLPTVCAAGCAMEMALGRRLEPAWDRCADDRELMARLVGDRTGEPMDRNRVETLFRDGMAQCAPLLAHESVRTAAERLATCLADRWDENGTGLDAMEIRDATRSLLGGGTR